MGHPPLLSYRHFARHPPTTTPHHVKAYTMTGGRGAEQNLHAGSESRHTKAMAEEYEKAKSNTTDDKFKKTHQVISGKPQVTDHNIADDYIKNPPRNLPGDPSGDHTIGTGEEEAAPQADTVQAKDPSEIQARIDAQHK